MASSAASRDVAEETLLLLEHRLARLEFYLGKHALRGAANGSNTADAPGEESVAVRLARVERKLADFCSKNSGANDLLRIYQQLPEVTEASRTSSTREERERQLAEVLASDDDFGPLNSQLTALQGQHMADARHLASLVGIEPRLARATAVQARQRRETEELRRRTAVALAAWYEQTVLEGGEGWVEAERRLARMDVELRRAEHQHARDAAQV